MIDPRLDRKRVMPDAERSRLENFMLAQRPMVLALMDLFFRETRIPMSRASPLPYFRNTGWASELECLSSQTTGFTRIDSPVRRNLTE